MTLLNIKYRPRKLAEIIGLTPEIGEYLKNPSLPSFLFSGPPGTGKTSTALVISLERDADTMKLNASDERGIDTIRGKVLKFATSKSMVGKTKIIILDEADGLSPDAQQTLRGTIDKVSHNCTFILTCNFEGKLIDPLKSRLHHIRFETPKPEEIAGRLRYICEQEKIDYEQSALEKIVSLYHPDIRECIKQLDILSTRDKKVTLTGINNRVLSIPVLISLLKGKKLLEAGQLIDSKWIDIERLMQDLSDEFFYGEYKDEQKRVLNGDIVRRAYYEMSRVKNYKPVIRPMLMEIMRTL